MSSAKVVLSGLVVVSGVVELVVFGVVGVWACPVVSVVQPVRTVSRVIPASAGVWRCGGVRRVM